MVYGSASASIPNNSEEQKENTVRKADLDAYYDSIYRAEHPLLEKIFNDNPSSIGKHPVKRQTTFSYSNNYVPSSASVNTQKAVGQIEITPGTSPSGAKTYIVPIKCYKADGVFSPDISLSYSSQGRGGSVGERLDSRWIAVDYTREQNTLL